MSLVQTITASSAPISVGTTSIMSSQHPNSASTATNPVLAPLQASTSSNVPITPSKARKQAQAQRTRLVALSKHLMTRLQYANFKVEHGWSKQSLSEVENLYYRQNQSSTSAGTGTASSAVSATTTAAAAAARKSASTSPNSSKAAVTPSAAATQGPIGVGSRLFKDATVKKIDVEGGDVFGGYGLATPPASAGSVPGATSYLNSKRGRSSSSTPISPPNTSATSSATKSADAASTKRSPNNSTSNGSRALPGTSGGATSYADFWSRVGTSAVSAAAANASKSSSPSKKRSAEDVSAGQEDRIAGGSEAAATNTTTTASPHKRVRMESDADRDSGALRSVPSSPAKAALAERGPSFASSARRV